MNHKVQHFKSFQQLKIFVQYKAYQERTEFQKRKTTGEPGERNGGPL